jgi:Protein of unknown function (DUF1091)
MIFLITLSNFFQFKLHFSIYKLECINEKDTNYTKNISCHLKTVSRGSNVLTSLSDFVQPLNFINLNILVFQKQSTNSYPSAIINSSVEVCSAMGDEASPLMKLCMPMITKFAPTFLHACPYEGRKIGVENFPIDISLLPIIQLSNVPKGDYQVVTINIWDTLTVFSNIFLGHNF